MKKKTGYFPDLEAVASQKELLITPKSISSDDYPLERVPADLATMDKRLCALEAQVARIVSALEFRAILK